MPNPRSVYIGHAPCHHLGCLVETPRHCPYCLLHTHCIHLWYTTCILHSYELYISSAVSTPISIINRSHVPTPPQVPLQEKLALLEFKSAMDVPGQLAFLSNWLPDTDPCDDNWQGVVCNCLTVCILGGLCVCTYVSTCETYMQHK